jgi:long-subunit fatty acid transport protein
LRDVPRIMFGIEYVLENLIAIRAGYTYQKSAVANRMIHPVFPDMDSNILSFGLGYEGPAFSIWRSGERIGGLSLDAYLQYGFSKDMKSALSPFPATYKESRWAVGVGVGFNFGSH